MRKKHEKVQNIYSSWQFSHRIFVTTDHKSLHLCNEITVDFTSFLIYKFLLQSACFILKRKDQEGCRNFCYNKFVMCPNILLPLPLVQHSAAATLKGLILKDVPETSPTAAV